MTLLLDGSMIICGRKTKINKILRHAPVKNDTKLLERVAATLTRKYSYSVYKHELNDLKQTIWYLMILAKVKYDPNRGAPIEAWAYYYANMKLRDHFWRGANLPQTKGSFTLLHTKGFKIVEFE